MRTLKLIKLWTVGIYSWEDNMKNKKKRKEKDATRFWVFGCNSCVILWLADFMHMDCRYI